MNTTIPEQFKNDMKQFVSLEMQIKQLNTQIAELRKQRTTIETGLIRTINTIPDLQHANINCLGKTITIANENKYDTLTYEFVRKSLGILIKNNEKANEIVNEMKKMRKCEQQQTLKLH